MLKYICFTFIPSDIYFTFYCTPYCLLQTQSQVTPLHTAVTNGMTEVTKILIEYGANIDARDCYGRYEQFSILEQTNAVKLIINAIQSP